MDIVNILKAKTLIMAHDLRNRIMDDYYGGASETEILARQVYVAILSECIRGDGGGFKGAADAANAAFEIAQAFMECPARALDIKTESERRAAEHAIDRSHLEQASKPWLNTYGSVLLKPKGEGDANPEE